MAEKHYPLTGIERHMKYHPRGSALSSPKVSDSRYTAQQVKQLLYALMHPSNPINVPDAVYKPDTVLLFAAVLATETPDDEQFLRAPTQLELEIRKWEAAKNPTGTDLYQRLCLLDYIEGHGFCEPTHATFLRYEAILERTKQMLVKALVSGEHIPQEAYPVLFDGTWYLSADTEAYIPATVVQPAASENYPLPKRQGDSVETSYALNIRVKTVLRDVSGEYVPLSQGSSPVRASHLHVVPKPTATVIDFPEGLELGLLRASAHKGPA